MKNLFKSLLLLVAFSATAIFSSCEEEETLVPKPQITIPSDVSGFNVNDGETKMVTLPIIVDGGIKNVTATSANNNTVTVSNLETLIGQVAGNLQISLTGASVGEDKITVVITDNKDQVSQAIFEIMVNPVGSPTIALDGETPTDVKFNTPVDLVLTIGAANTIKDITITSELGNEITFDKADLIDEESGDLTVSFLASTKVGAEVLTVVVTGKYDLSTTKTISFDVAKNQIVVTDEDLTSDAHWTVNSDYLLDGLVYLESGTLTIDAGVVVRGKTTPSGSDKATALIITKGAKIEAVGTADAPIIFTGESDMLDGALTKAKNKLWAGIILLGDAPIEKKGAFTYRIEGIDSNEDRAECGGTNANDNSGILKYVSIRYTGYALSAGNEIQGLTLGAVGDGTEIEYIDIFSSADDGIEIFGGTVNIKHISVAFATDDSFDFDLGWRGSIQYLFTIQDGTREDTYDHAGEWDGASPDDATLFSMPHIYNATFVGVGQVRPDGGRDKAVLMRDNFAGYLRNSVLVDFPGVGIEVEDLEGTSDSYNRLGDKLFIENNTWSAFAGATNLNELLKITSNDVGAADVDPTGTKLLTHLDEGGNTFEVTSVVKGISRTRNGQLDPRPSTNDTDVKFTDKHSAIEEVTYRGAFDAEAANWLNGWSTLSKYGFLAE